jgi:hypothetical protein
LASPGCKASHTAPACTSATLAVAISPSPTAPSWSAADPLTKWLLGFHLMAASKKGVSAHQLHRMLEVTYKTAWFMARRIREAMSQCWGYGT